MENEILLILKHIEQKRGYDFSGNRLSMLERRLSKRLHITGYYDLNKYLEYIQKNDNELDELIQTLTINVTSFFRDPLIWELLNTNVVSRLIENIRNSESDVINVWSAGCATGEEAYTIAMILMDAIEQEKKQININIVGTDINDVSLEFAKKGEYLKKHIINIKLRLIEKYFRSKYDVYNIVDELKNKVRFSNYDLLNQTQNTPPFAPKDGFDLVICRNVLIYFNNNHQERIFNKLNSSLNNHGFIILGEAEIPTERFKSKFTKINSCCKIYNRINNNTREVYPYSQSLEM